MTDLQLDAAAIGRSPAPTVPGAASSASRAALAAAVLGFFIVTFDAVVLNVSLPSIRTDLGGGISGLQWVVDGYTLGRGRSGSGRWAEPSHRPRPPSWAAYSPSLHGV